MRCNGIEAGALLVVLLMGSTIPASAQDSAPLILADNGRAKFEIIIGKAADYGEDLAAKIQQADPARSPRGY